MAATTHDAIHSLVHVQSQPNINPHVVANNVLEMAGGSLGEAPETRSRRQDSGRSGEEDGHGRHFVEASGGTNASSDDPHRLTVGSSRTKGSSPDSVKEEENEDTYDSCCICFEGKDYILTSCCHLFCLLCITRWIEISSTCPICRNDFETSVELYNLIGSVEDTVRAIKEVHKRKRELENKRREWILALQAESAASGSSLATWGIFNQVMEILFPASVDGERMTLGGQMEMIEEDDDPATLAPHLNLTRVNVNGHQPTQNVALAHHNHHQLTVTPSFPFLSFCCFPQSPTSIGMSPMFERAARSNQIH